jgi:hypothetical protein
MLLLWLTGVGVLFEDVCVHHSPEADSCSQQLNNCAIHYLNRAPHLVQADDRHALRAVVGHDDGALPAAAVTAQHKPAGVAAGRQVSKHGQGD